MSRIRDIANILSGVSTDMATDAEVTSSIASHSAAADPHTGYVRKSTLTTAGDLIYASAANTPARLGIGANGTYLTSNGSVPSWGTVSSGMTLIQKLTGSNSSISFNSIPSTYTHLKLVGQWDGGSGQFLSMTTNGTSPSFFSVYSYSTNNNSVTTSASGSSANIAYANVFSNPIAFQATISNYTSTGTKSYTSTAGSQNTWFIGGGNIVTSVAINSITLSYASGSYTVCLYGLS